jgi:UDP-glucose 4-epimerase
MARILAVGGAGYVGGSVCAWLKDRGHELWVLDDLSTGHRDFVEAAGSRGFTHARAGDRAKVAALLSRQKFDCVMHFAASALVEESSRRPELYLENNVEQTRALIEVMLEHGLRRLVFSSTCAIFGDPDGLKISETLEKKPVNPYGESKLLAEAMIEEFAAEGLQAIALRYFNAAGADPKLRVGEWHSPETHLIPAALSAGRAGRAVSLFGTDYPTPDGSCVRDYVHVHDLAAAHEAAMDRLLALPQGGGFEAFNLGSEKGSSVREVIAACSAALGTGIQIDKKPRRAGDPTALVADSAQAREALGFKPVYGLKEIVESALAWENKRAGISRKAVFLDRDGTLNHDPGYLNDPDALKLLDGASGALAELKAAGYVLIVVSNQSGVGRGLIEPSSLEKIHERLGDLLRSSGAAIDHYELCLHSPEADCDCRKPKPKLLLDAASKLGIDMKRSYMIGDKASDVAAGLAAGCAASLLVRTGEGARTEKELAPGQAAFVGDSIQDVVKWIVKDQRSAHG